jgi:hypothetical protein
MTYQIGLPPKMNLLGDGVSSMDIKKNYIKIKLTPLKIQAHDANEITSQLTGKINLVDATDDFKKRMKYLYEDEIETPPLMLHVLSEAPFSESYNNDIENVTLMGMLTNEITSTGLYGISLALKQSGVDIGEVMRSATKGTSAEGATEKTISGTEKMLRDIGDSSYVANTLGQYLPKDFQGLSTIGGKVAEHIMGLMSGNRPVFPNIWNNSSFSCGYNYSIRLYNPNPANRVLHMQNIVKPLCALLTLVLPFNEKGNTYTSPLYVKAESTGLFQLPAGMITNMNIIRGGDDNAIAFNGRPTLLDIRFSITPLYDKRLLGVSPDNAFCINSDINVLKEEISFSDEIASSNQPSTIGQRPNEVTKSIEPSPRNKEKEEEMYFRLQGFA